MIRVVKCPKCGEIVQTTGKYFFRHCNMSFSVEKCLLTEIEQFRFRKKDKAKNKENDEYIDVEIVDDEDEYIDVEIVDDEDEYIDVEIVDDENQEK